MSTSLAVARGRCALKTKLYLSLFDECDNALPGRTLQARRHARKMHRGPPRERNVSEENDALSHVSLPLILACCTHRLNRTRTVTRMPPVPQTSWHSSTVVKRTVLESSSYLNILSCTYNCMHAHNVHASALGPQRRWWTLHSLPFTCLQGGGALYDASPPHGGLCCEALTTVWSMADSHNHASILYPFVTLPWDQRMEMPRV